MAGTKSKEGEPVKMPPAYWLIETPRESTPWLAETALEAMEQCGLPMEQIVHVARLTEQRVV
jgi:hypothetical protein